MALQYVPTMDLADINLTPHPPAAIAYGFVVAITILLDLPPLVWHCRNRNIAAGCMISWIIVNNFLGFINVMIWPNDQMKGRFSGHVLCDIEVKIMVARSTALPAAIFCIMKSLADVMDTSKVNLAPTTAQKKRAMASTLAFALGIPAITMFLHYVVQPYRYNIVGMAGCVPNFYQSPLTVLLLDVPPVILTLADAYLSCLIIVRLKNYRSNFTSMLNAANTTKTRFLRLLILALIFIFCLFPIQIYILFLNWPSSPEPYSWARVHSAEAWSHVYFIPSYGLILPDRWVNIACGLLVFALFGLGRDATTTYKSWLLSIGLGKVFPHLKETRPRNANGSSGSFGSRIKLIVPARFRHREAGMVTLDSTGTAVSMKDLDTPHSANFPIHHSAASDAGFVNGLSHDSSLSAHSPARQETKTSRFAKLLHSPAIPVGFGKFQLPLKKDKSEDGLPLTELDSRDRK